MLASQLLSLVPSAPFRKPALMRVIAALLTLVFLAAAIWQGQRLWQQVQQPEAAPWHLAAVRPASPANQVDSAPPPRRWPALFGTPVVIEPQPPQPVAVAEPQPPAPPLPPVESLGYRLKGVVRNGSADWAILSHPTGDLILRVGDNLVEGVRVEAIEAEGLWLSRRGERVLLGFETLSP